MSELPIGWEKVEFDEAVNIVSDRGRRIKQKEYLLEGAIPVIDQGESIIGGYTNNIEAKIESHTPIIVFGDHTRRFKFIEFPFAVGADGVKLFSANVFFDSAFLFQQLTALNFEDRGYGRHYQYLRKEKILVPPLGEQTRIVTKLEELFSDLDAGVAELKAAQKKLTQFRQSLLKAAVEGTLTADWRAKNPTKETGVQLLERILIERRARWEAKQLAKFQEQGKTPPKYWQKKYPEPIQPNTRGLPELPEGWVWASLDMLGEIASGVAKGTKRDSSLITREVPYLRVANVQRGYLDLKEVKTILAIERDISDLTLKDGDILFNEGGDRDKLGRGWVWRSQISECIHQNHVFRMRPYIDDLQSELISHHGNTFGKLWFQNVGKQTTNLASINMGMLRAFPVPLSSLAEQFEILTQIQEQIEQLTIQENTIELAIKNSAAQRQNILRAAFSGQLVPQDPNDEPAAVLLERIRAKRAAQEMVKKPRGRRAAPKD